MQFKIGDRIGIIGAHPRRGELGIVVRGCGTSRNCRIIKFADGCTQHVIICNLTLKTVKHEQLVFSFME